MSLEPIPSVVGILARDNHGFWRVTVGDKAYPISATLVVNHKENEAHVRAILRKGTVIAYFHLFPVEPIVTATPHVKKAATPGAVKAPEVAKTPEVAAPEVVPPPQVAEEPVSSPPTPAPE